MYFLSSVAQYCRLASVEAAYYRLWGILKLIIFKLGVSVNGI